MKILDRGYWVSTCYKYTSLVYWFFYSVYFRSLTFFSAANPAIYLGGMLDERKSDIYKLLPPENLPKTKIYSTVEPGVKDRIITEFELPFILKPNIGYKGFMVMKVDNANELEALLKGYGQREILVQEFLSEEHEFAAMYYRIDEQTYGISSLIEKHLPYVSGDGVSTLKQLIQEVNNPFLNKNWAMEKKKNQLNLIPAKNERILVDHIGNYARGAKFEALNSQIDMELIDSLNSFFKKVKGINFCRIDLKAESLAELRSGRFRILEVNGAKSEPLHIYDPKVGLFNIVWAIHNHWRILFKVVKANIRNLNYPSSAEGIKAYFTLKKLVS